MPLVQARIEQGEGLLTRDNVRQALWLLGQHEVGCRMRLADLLGNHEPVQPLDCRDGALDGRRGQPRLVKRLDVLLDRRPRHVIRTRDAHSRQIRQIAPQVTAVGLHRVLRAAPLHGEVPQILVSRPRQRCWCLAVKQHARKSTGSHTPLSRSRHECLLPSLAEMRQGARQTIPTKQHRCRRYLCRGRF